MNDRLINQAEVLANISSLKKDLIEQIYPEEQVSCANIIQALQQFNECVRYLNTRRSKGTIIDITSEGNVQDLVYLMLRAWIHDVIPENPTSRTTNRFSIKDFLIKSAKTVIEAKYIRDVNHGKNISKELHDDIEMYRKHPDCENLIFFIYDPDSSIPDVAAIKRSIEEERIYSGRVLHCFVIIP